MTVTESPVTSGFRWMLGGEPWMTVWPTIESELRKVVCRKIPVDCDVSDVLQEVCTRMLESDRKPGDPGEAVRYATTIACNYVRDLHRRRNRSLPAGLFDGASQDVERAVLARLRFEALEHKVAALDANDRQAFADPQGDPSLKTGAMRVRRSRVRARLAASIKSAVGGGFALPRLRWLLIPTSAAALFVPALPMLPDAKAEAPDSARASARPSEPDSSHRYTYEAPGRPPSGTTHVAPTASSRPGGGPYADQRGQYRPDHSVEGPLGTGAESGTWEPPAGNEEQPLVCLSGVSPNGDVCTPPEAHPRNLEPSP